jgi:hypothetical protein
MEAILIVLGSLGIVLVWRRIFIKGGILILTGMLIIFFLASMISFNFGFVFLLTTGTGAALYQFWRKKDLPEYTEAEASFETSDILRGLSPVEAAYFLQLSSKETFCTAVLNLLDKGILFADFNESKPKINLSPEYELKDQFLSPDDRIKFRKNAGFKEKHVLRRYDDAILELIPAEKGVEISKIKYKIWYRAFQEQMNDLAQVYDFERTRKYAAELVHKITAPGSEFSSGKRNLSGWYAVRVITGPDKIKITHRPSWLAKDDEFGTFVNKFLEQIPD